MDIQDGHARWQEKIGEERDFPADPTLIWSEIFDANISVFDPE